MRFDRHTSDTWNNAMERWKELIAGYVLENLTDEESQELSEILRDNPHLQLEISRLRKTATMSGSQRADRSSDTLAVGAEGWTDTVDRLSDAQLIQPVFPEKKPLLETVAKSAPVEVASPISSKLSFWRVFCRRWLPAKETTFQRTSLFGWLMALVLIGVGIDNWRVRRLLAIAQERILQLEMSAEYQPGRGE